MARKKTTRKKKARTQTTGKKQAPKQTDSPPEPETNDAASPSLSQEETRQDTPRKGWLIRLLSNPWYGGIAGTCSIISVPLALGLALFAISSRTLTYCTSPSKTIIFKQGECPADLQLTYKGNEVSSDVTATQIALWNNGNTSIRREHILDGVRILIEPSRPVLDVRIKETSREVGGITYSEDGYDRGAVPVSWDILERADGAVFQVTYAGTTECTLRVEGVIEGQSAVQEYQQPNDRPVRWVAHALFVVSLMAGGLFATGWLDTSVTCIEKVNA